METKSKVSTIFHWTWFKTHLLRRVYLQEYLHKTSFTKWHTIRSFQFCSLKTIYCFLNSYNYLSESRDITALNTTMREIIDYWTESRSRDEIAEHVGIETPSYVVQRYLRPLLDMGLLEMTMPDKPKSKNQKYVAVEQWCCQKAERRLSLSSALLLRLCGWTTTGC